MNTTAFDVRVKAWTPAVPCKIQDNIVSSDYASTKVFVPSYEKEKRPCMEQLLANEYQRIWWEEKKTWDKMFTRKPTKKKILPRTVIKKRQPATPKKELQKPKTKPRKEKKTEKRKEDSRDTEDCNETRENEISE